MTFFSPKRTIPKVNQNKNQNKIYILCILSLLFFIFVRYVPLGKEDNLQKDMREASEIMAKAQTIIRLCREEKGIRIDRNSDVNQTGLIGVEFSSITTSIGSLEAKRTTTNPNFASLIVYLLKKAGVNNGDTIAVGASSSFPALILAVLSASKAMKVRPLMIHSLGASQWGANIPDFNWLHMQGCLSKGGMFETQPIAFSLGGEKDTGSDIDSEARSLLLKDVQASGILFINEPDLGKNIQERMRVYETNAGEKEIKAFINIGGSLSNMGIDSKVLKLKPGLTDVNSIPLPEKRGVIHLMAIQKIPIIHLLFIKGLVERYKLQWDPVPLPQPGRGEIYQFVRTQKPSFIVIAGLYLLCVIFVICYKTK